MSGQRTIVFALVAFHTGIVATSPATRGQDSSGANTTSDPQADDQEWTGRLSDETVLTRADLVEILNLHRRWLETGGEEGARADLRRADLRGAYLIDADLSGADLRGADLRGAYLIDADLSGADLSGADLRGADLRVADLGGAYLFGADLRGAYLSDADLSGANLSDANLSGADLAAAVFEPMPNSLPYMPSLASAGNLDKLRYLRSGAGLVELRNALRQAGLRRQEREVNYALLKCRRMQMQEDPLGFGDRVDALFNYVFFESTCKYGLLPGRPLQIMGVAVLAFAVPYFLVLRRKERSSRADIWLEVEDESIRANRTRKRRLRLLVNTGPAPSWRARLKRSRRTLFAALYFSLLTAFRVGFREINVGNWISRMQCREYTVRATGWIRFVTGLQSLMSVYLLALWLVTYFGRPFE